MVTITHSRPRRRKALALAVALCFAAGANAQTNTAGAITGRAIYEGSLDFSAAQALADELCGGKTS